MICTISGISKKEIIHVHGIMGMGLSAYTCLLYLKYTHSLKESDGCLMGATRNNAFTQSIEVTRLVKM